MRFLTTILFLLFLLPGVSAFGQSGNGDVNCSDNINILDITYLISFLYKSGPAPCEIHSSGVSYSTLDPVAIDIDGSWTTMIGVSITAPDYGFVALDYSFYTQTETSYFELLLGELMKDGDSPEDSKDPSYVTVYDPSSPTSWHQVMSISPGTHYFSLAVRYGPRDENNTDDKALVTFRNVNLSVTFHPNYYGPRK
ncbi:MAG: hypothetical protein ABIJ45_14095 [Candidatus Zixiibacteriota bacterium]